MAKTFRGNLVTNLDSGRKYSINEAASILGVTKDDITEYIVDGRLTALNNHGHINICGTRIKEFYATFSDGEEGYKETPNDFHDYYSTRQVAEILGIKIPEVEELIKTGVFNDDELFAVKVYESGCRSYPKWIIPKCTVKKAEKMLKAKRLKSKAKMGTITVVDGEKYCDVRRAAYMLGMSTAYVHLRIREGHFDTALRKEPIPSGFVYLIHEPAIVEYAAENGIALRECNDAPREDYKQVTVDETPEQGGECVIADDKKVQEITGIIENGLPDLDETPTFMQTNFERIKMMGLSELAAVLKNADDCSTICAKAGTCGERHDCQMGIEEWLMREDWKYETN